MTTPQWTIDDGMLIFDPVPDEDGNNICRALIQHNDMDHLAFKALVADVAAARLVDDMAAVVRRQDAGWRPLSERLLWIRGRYGFDSKTEPMSPGEVAALHHARQQEETPCPTCQGDGFIEADEGDPVFDPEDRCADCPTCGGSGEVAALHHARQQDAVPHDSFGLNVVKPGEGS